MHRSNFPTSFLLLLLPLFLCFLRHLWLAISLFTSDNSLVVIAAHLHMHLLADYRAYACLPVCQPRNSCLRFFPGRSCPVTLREEGACERFIFFGDKIFNRSLVARAFARRFPACLPSYVTLVTVVCDSFDFGEIVGRCSMKEWRVNYFFSFWRKNFRS